MQLALDRKETIEQMQAADFDYLYALKDVTDQDDVRSLRQQRRSTLLHLNEEYMDRRRLPSTDTLLETQLQAVDKLRAGLIQPTKTRSGTLPNIHANNKPSTAQKKQSEKRDAKNLLNAMSKVCDVVMLTIFY